MNYARKIDFTRIYRKENLFEFHLKSLLESIEIFFQIFHSSNILAMYLNPSLTRDGRNLRGITVIVKVHAFELSLINPIIHTIEVL